MFIAPVHLNRLCPYKNALLWCLKMLWRNIHPGLQGCITFTNLCQIGWIGTLQYMHVEGMFQLPTTRPTTRTGLLRNEKAAIVIPPETARSSALIYTISGFIRWLSAISKACPCQYIGLSLISLVSETPKARTSDWCSPSRRNATLCYFVHIAKYRSRLVSDWRRRMASLLCYRWCYAEYGRIILLWKDPAQHRAIWTLLYHIHQGIMPSPRHT